jgi:hypothetical protein
MHKCFRYLVWVVLALLVLIPALALAQSGGDYDLSWWTVDGGGASVSEDASSTYVLGGSIGQPDAATWLGDGYILTGGFWCSDVVEHDIYLPLVLRGT